MTVELIYHTPLSIMAQAGRTAWQSFHRGGVYDTPTDNISDTDIEFIDRIVNKHKHGSVSEHVSYTFSIKGVSRACLQEISRHRHQSLTVKSTRYTLKELKDEEQLNDFHNENDYKRASKYLVWTGNHNVDITTFFMLEDLRSLVQEGISNDIVKFALPENYKTSLISTFNTRSLQNFLNLRTDKAALWEIRQLAYKIYDLLPEQHKFLFNGYIHEDTQEKK